MIFTWILIGAVVGLLLWVVSTYNFFASSKTRVGAAVQEIGNQLKRQADLIPNLEESVKGYLKHEKEVFKMLTDARKAVVSAAESGNLQKMSDAGSQFAQVLPKLQIAVESNPEIKGSTVVAQLMNELRDTADKVMYARRLLIDLTVDFNVKRVTFPSSLVASTFGFEELVGLSTPKDGDHIKVAEGDLKTPKVSL